MGSDLGFVQFLNKKSDNPLKFNEENPVTLQSIQSVDELVTTLSEGERMKFGDILQSLNLPSNAFDNYCSWSSESYTRNCIIETEKFELILLCWEKGQITPIHDHGGEECWVKIIEGEFKETIYKEDETGELNVVKSTIAKSNDITYMIDFMGFHSLENVSNKRSMSLHLYANPIRNCNILDEDSRKLVKKEMVYDTIA